ncbi:MAG: hypothetical protein HYS81_04410 [Candidatus Aenigmatarchaeota archaeon]|nr:MAG: hypothetical protein HYS81_04410 [Candidatus Aenigmarchaeota archaeon]
MRACKNELPALEGRKGQSLTIEQMFLFTIGLVITLSILFSFRAISDRVAGLAEDDQLNEAGALVMTGMERVAKELSYSSSASVTIEIPKEISMGEYTVAADGARLIVLSDNANSTMDIEGVAGAYLVSGTVSSSAGAIRIEGSRAGKTIRLLRPSI